MARGINKVILIGNLGRDPETRYTQGGSPVTNFSVATSESWKDRQTGENQERTEWHNVVCFGRQAEVASQYLRKGSKVFIEGSLRTSSWEQDGQKKYRTEIACRDFQMLDSRGQGGDNYNQAPGGFQQQAPRQAPPAAAAPQQGGAAPQQAPAQPGPADFGDFDDDIPF